MSRKMISRRTFAVGAAVGLGGSMAGCTDPSSIGGLKRLSPVVKYKDQGHRLWGVVPANGTDFDDSILPHLDPRPVWRYETWLDHDTKSAGVAFHCIVWATKKDAERLLKNPAVQSIVEKTPEHVLETGIATEANGKLAVQFLPNSRNYAGNQTPSASIGQIILDWREATNKLNGIEIISVSQPTTQESESFHPDPEQVIIQFETPTLSQDVLDIVKQHPQTMSIKWGGPFMLSPDCPGCGMG